MWRAAIKICGSPNRLSHFDESHIVLFRRYGKGVGALAQRLSCTDCIASKTALHLGRRDRPELMRTKGRAHAWAMSMLKVRGVFLSINMQ